MAFRRDRAWANRKRAVMIDGIGDAPDMPELKEDAAAGSMHALHDFAPAFDLLAGPDARRMRIADACRRDRCRLGKDKAGRCALGIILAHHRIRNPARAGRSVAGQGRKENAVRNFQIANLQRVEQGRH